MVRHATGHDIDIAPLGGAHGEGQTHRSIAGNREAQGATLAGQEDPQGRASQLRACENSLFMPMV
jgi:hypothetical protein